MFVKKSLYKENRAEQLALENQPHISVGYFDLGLDGSVLDGLEITYKGSKVQSIWHHRLVVRNESEKEIENLQVSLKASGGEIIDARLCGTPSFEDHAELNDKEHGTVLIKIPVFSKSKPLMVRVMAMNAQSHYLSIKCLNAGLRMTEVPIQSIGINNVQLAFFDATEAQKVATERISKVRLDISKKNQTEA